MGDHRVIDTRVTGDLGPDVEESTFPTSNLLDRATFTDDLDRVLTARDVAAEARLHLHDQALRAAYGRLRDRLDVLDDGYTPKAGAEAEELRKGIESLLMLIPTDEDIEELDDVRDELQALLDRVDARDSLKSLEENDPPEEDPLGPGFATLEADVLRRETNRLHDSKGWAPSMGPLEIAAMRFASAWVREAPFAAGLGAVTGLRKAGEAHDAAVDALEEATIRTLVAGSAEPASEWGPARTLLAQLDAARAERDEAREMLGKCYDDALGRDPDEPSDWTKTWTQAGAAVAELRVEWDEIQSVSAQNSRAAADADTARAEGVEVACSLIEGGNFLHRESGEARMARGIVAMLRRDAPAAIKRLDRARQTALLDAGDGLDAVRKHIRAAEAGEVSNGHAEADLNLALAEVERLRARIADLERAPAPPADDGATEGRTYEIDIRRLRYVLGGLLLSGRLDNLTARDLDAQAAQLVLDLRDAKEAEAERDALVERLTAGTLHVLTCNADHTKPVGGDGCSCPAGREIHRLRAQVVALAAAPNAYHPDPETNAEVAQEAAEGAAFDAAAGIEPGWHKGDPGSELARLRAIETAARASLTLIDRHREIYGYEKQAYALDDVKEWRDLRAALGGPS